MSLRSKIKNYTRLFPRVKNLIIYKSTRAGKRFTAEFDLAGRHRMVHFGLAGAFTWFDGAEKTKRDSYRARASKIKNAAGKYTYKIAGTANSFAYHILW